MDPTPPNPAPFETMPFNAMKLLVLLVLAISTFGGLYWAPEIDAIWGSGTAYLYGASVLPVLYVLLVAAYALYMHRHPEKDVQVARSHHGTHP
ncbi:hypothetical protein HS961_09705 [Comamonas piscis]|uniref:Uncharacterized protein n=1 Tax=Comamonas piscis TaxID=1562974 RepID=A0A7G5EGG1_9BURK|nr:hypothetical protein [Comamonas piscis]QMV73086.1 hypothetical protein HS961_09705 [Comamonas piscis]WSO35873.1 hypothetical protein VUJ63_09735 [Comamonas piscis]